MISALLMTTWPHGHDAARPREKLSRCKTRFRLLAKQLLDTPFVPKEISAGVPRGVAKLRPCENNQIATASSDIQGLEGNV
jgi:hypothetical protein